MNNSKLDVFIRPIAARLQANHMSRLGIANTMRLAYFYNRLKFGRQNRWRGALYQTQLATLLEENGRLSRPPIEMKDGWALDTSMSLPYLDRVLEDSDKIIAERSGERRSSKGAYRSYFQDVWTPEDLERYPSFLDFATSSDVLSVVSHYLQSIPVLSTALPAGIRFVECLPEAQWKARGWTANSGSRRRAPRWRWQSRGTTDIFPDPPVSRHLENS